MQHFRIGNPPTIGTLNLKRQDICVMVKVLGDYLYPKKEQAVFASYLCRKSTKRPGLHFQNPNVSIWKIFQKG